ncbi:unnamed protein product [Caenorhabditis nigoni]
MIKSRKSYLCIFPSPSPHVVSLHVSCLDGYHRNFGAFWARLEDAGLGSNSRDSFPLGSKYNISGDK